MDTVFVPFFFGPEERHVFDDVVVITDGIHVESIKNFQSEVLFGNVFETLMPIFGVTDFAEKFFHDRFAGTFDTDIKKPVQMVDTGGNNFQITGLPAEHFCNNTE